MRHSVAAVIGTFILSAPVALADDSGDLAEAVARMARIGSCYSPSFSPDGKEIAFVADLTGVPQVWRVGVEGGWPRQVTALEDQVGSVSWSPAGGWLAFSLAPGGGMNQQVYLVRADGREMTRLTDGGKDNNWLGEWSHDGALLSLASNRNDPRSMDAFLYDLEGGKLELLAKNDGIGNLTDLSRDSRRAVISRMKDRGDDNMFLLDMASGKEALLTPHEGPSSFGGGHFSPDGRTIYLATNAERDLIALGRVAIDAAGVPGPIEVIAERDDAELQDFELSPDGRTAALLWNVAGRSELSFLDLGTLEEKAGPPLPADIAGGLTFSPDGRRIAMALSGANAPSDIWLLDMPGGEPRQLTFSPHAGVDLESLVRPELVRFEAHDGLELSGWLYRPEGARGPGPVVLSFHGGPEGQERPSFRANYQALLSRGIGVFAPNVRGSSGFGKRFVNLDNGALRADGVKDIASCLDHVIKTGVADPKRIGIMGGSYGGYMVMAGLTEYPDRFAAGANLFGVVNFQTFFAQTEPWMAEISKVEYGDPNTEAGMLRALSPIHKVNRVTAPTIVLHGANDTNVPVVEAEQVVESLKRRGIPVQYVLFPDEGHGFRKAGNRVRATVSIVEWFDRYLNR